MQKQNSNFILFQELFNYSPVRDLVSLFRLRKK